MWVNNQGSTDLYLRLRVAVAGPPGFPPSDSAISTVPVFLSAGSGWTAVTFPITAGDLTALAGSAATALSKAAELRSIHNPNPTFPPPAIAAQLGGGQHQSGGPSAPPLSAVIAAGLIVVRVGTAHQFQRTVVNSNFP